ncbi:DUF4404 family protein [Undibacterium arcticum]|uniref:DUF4404 family protein n=1 Tax=Undibacterium arcticum TaxID=1762892 RepID=A0ABV7FCA5_9BURK
MDTEQLKASLKKLHANLEDADTLDGELKELLQVLDSDIQSLLGKGQSTAERNGTDQPLGAEAVSLAARTQSLSARFAAEHPRLDPVLRELGAILEKMGI